LTWTVKYLNGIEVIEGQFTKPSDRPRHPISRMARWPGKNRSDPIRPLPIDSAAGKFALAPGHVTPSKSPGTSPKALKITASSNSPTFGSPRRENAADRPPHRRPSLARAGLRHLHGGTRPLHRAPGRLTRTNGLETLLVSWQLSASAVTLGGASHDDHSLLRSHWCHSPCFCDQFRFSICVRRGPSFGSQIDSDKGQLRQHFQPALRHSDQVIRSLRSL
jgi:hypothetical protein